MRWKPVEPNYALGVGPGQLELNIFSPAPILLCFWSGWLQGLRAPALWSHALGSLTTASACLSPRVGRKVAGP